MVTTVCFFEGLPSERSCLLLLGGDLFCGLIGLGRRVGVVKRYFGGRDAGVDGLHLLLKLYMKQHCLVLLCLYVYP